MKFSAFSHLPDNYERLIDKTITSLLIFSFFGFFFTDLNSSYIVALIKQHEK